MMISGIRSPEQQRVRNQTREIRGFGRSPGLRSGYRWPVANKGSREAVKRSNTAPFRRKACLGSPEVGKAIWQLG